MTTVWLRLFAFAIGLSWAIPTSQAADFRFELGVGLAHGDHDISYGNGVPLADLSVSSDSALNGSGLAATVGVWADRILFETLSFGVEYLRLENSADLALDVRAAEERVSLDTEFSLDMDAVMLNGAYRLNSGPTHPYISLGFGVARLRGVIDSDLAASRDIAAVNLLDFSDSDYAPAGQILVGFDHDLSERFYVGAAARYFLIDGRLFNRDEVVRELVATVTLGISF